MSEQFSVLEILYILSVLKEYRKTRQEYWEHGSGALAGNEPESIGIMIAKLERIAERNVETAISALILREI